LDLNNNGKIDSSDLKNLRHEKSETPTQEKKEHMNNDMEEVKEAAYYEGVFERAAEYGFSKQAAVELLYKIAGPFDDQDLNLGAGGEGAGLLGQVTSLPGSDFADKMRPFERFSKENGGLNNRFLNYLGGSFGGSGGVTLDNAATPEYMANQILGAKQFPDRINLNNPNPNAGLMEKIQDFIKSHKSGLGMGALGLGAAGLGAGAYALANRKSNKEKKGSLEDALALSLGQGAPENPNSLGAALELGNTTSLPGSDFEDVMRGHEHFSKENGGLHNMFNSINSPPTDLQIDKDIPPGYFESQPLGAKQFPDRINLNNPDPNATLMDKIHNFIKAHKSGLGMGAAGVGAAGLGAGAAYGLSRGKDKRK
jgi:hypothetical protein